MMSNSTKQGANVWMAVQYATYAFLLGLFMGAQGVL